MVVGGKFVPLKGPGFPCRVAEGSCECDDPPFGVAVSVALGNNLGRSQFRK